MQITTIIHRLSETIKSRVIQQRLLLKRPTWIRFPVWPSQRLQKLVFTASLLDVQQQEGQCEASTVCGRQVKFLNRRNGQNTITIEADDNGIKESTN